MGAYCTNKSMVSLPRNVCSRNLNALEYAREGGGVFLRSQRILRKMKANEINKFQPACPFAVHFDVCRYFCLFKRSIFVDTRKRSYTHRWFAIKNIITDIAACMCVYAMYRLDIRRNAKWIIFLLVKYSVHYQCLRSSLFRWPLCLFLLIRSVSFFLLLVFDMVFFSFLSTSFLFLFYFLWEIGNGLLKWIEQFQG